MSGDCVAGEMRSKRLRFENARARHVPRGGQELAADAELLDQRLVARLVRAPQIVQQLTAMADELQKAAPGIVVLGVRLKVPGQIVDAFGEDRHLNFRRPRVARLLGEFLDHFSLAAGRNRHRSSFRLPRYATFCGRARPTSPAKLNTRLGTISPRSRSARASNWPATVTETVPVKFGASLPRNKTAWPLESLAASARLTASAGMSSSAVSTGMSASARLPSPAAALWHRFSRFSSKTMLSEAKGPTAVRRRALTCPKQPSVRPMSRASDRT